MTRSNSSTEQSETATPMGSAAVELAKRPDRTWEATQQGLDVIGTGESAARATEDMAWQIAVLKAREEP